MSSNLLSIFMNFSFIFYLSFCCYFGDHDCICIRTIEDKEVEDKRMEEWGVENKCRLNLTKFQKKPVQLNR